MAVMTNQQRLDCLRDFMRGIPHDDSYSLTKDDIKAVIDALDDFLSSNASAINNVIPLPQRTILTQKQKAFLLVYVISSRYQLEA